MYTVTLLRWQQSSNHVSDNDALSVLQRYFLTGLTLGAVKGSESIYKSDYTIGFIIKYHLT